MTSFSNLTHHHIHTADDGRGPRKVYLNGTEVEAVKWADTERGLVQRFVRPYQANRRGQLKTQTLRGQVVVKPFE